MHPQKCPNALQPSHFKAKWHIPPGLQFGVWQSNGKVAWQPSRPICNKKVDGWHTKLKIKRANKNNDCPYLQAQITTWRARWEGYQASRWMSFAISWELQDAKFEKLHRKHAKMLQSSHHSKLSLNFWMLGVGWRWQRPTRRWTRLQSAQLGCWSTLAISQWALQVIHLLLRYSNNKRRTQRCLRALLHTNGTGKYPSLHTGQSWLCSYPSGLARPSRHRPCKTRTQSIITTARNSYSLHPLLSQCRSVIAQWDCQDWLQENHAEIVCSAATQAIAAATANPSTT